MTGLWFYYVFGKLVFLLFIMFVIFITEWDADDTDYVGSNGFFYGRNERALDCMFEQIFYELVALNYVQISLRCEIKKVNTK
jgi:hypothetical protein